MTYLSGRCGGSGDGTAAHNKSIRGGPSQDYKRAFRRASEAALATFTPIQRAQADRSLAEFIAANGVPWRVEYEAGGYVHVYLD